MTASNKNPKRKTSTKPKEKEVSFEGLVLKNQLVIMQALRVLFLHETLATLPEYLRLKAYASQTKAIVIKNWPGEYP